MEKAEDIKQDSTQKKPSKFDQLQEQVDESVRDKWIEEQARLKEKLVIEDDFDWYAWILHIWRK